MSNHAERRQAALGRVPTSNDIEWERLRQSAVAQELQERGAVESAAIARAAYAMQVFTQINPSSRGYAEVADSAAKLLRTMFDTSTDAIAALEYAGPVEPDALPKRPESDAAHG